MSDPCIYCGHAKATHDEPEEGGECACGCPRWRDEPSDNEMMNRPGVEGGIGYPIGAPALSEHDWRL